MCVIHLMQLNLNGCAVPEGMPSCLFHMAKMFGAIQHLIVIIVGTIPSRHVQLNRPLGVQVCMLRCVAQICPHSRTHSLAHDHVVAGPYPNLIYMGYACA